MPKSSASGTGASPKKTRATATNRNAQRGGAFVNHQAAIDFLDSRINVEQVRPSKVEKTVWELGRMRALLTELGDPQNDLEIVHIAGSKGKGSVCNMLEGAFEACGYTTGIFTSPHLMHVRERVRIGSHPISESVFDAALEQCRDAANAIENDHGRATYFEILTALALVVFAQEAVDLVVLETGIGGRLDCTNVVSPRICGLTNIHLEHTAILGHTLELIAKEKAGIMKPGAVTISTPQHDEVLNVFIEQASKTNTTLKVLGQDIVYTRRFQSGALRGPHARVCVGEGSGENDGGFEHMPVPLMGMHQSDNCALALAIILELREHGFDLPERMISAGFKQINTQGRLEKVMQTPRIYVDGAHTPESVRETLKAVGAHLNYDSLIVIFGCAADKHVDLMIGELDRGADKVIFTQASDNPRAIKADELLSRFEAGEHTAMAEAKDSVRDAINGAAKALSGNDLILVTGSFYIAGEVKTLVEASKARR